MADASAERPAGAENSVLLQVNMRPETRRKLQQIAGAFHTTETGALHLAVEALAGRLESDGALRRRLSKIFSSRTRTTS